MARNASIVIVGSGMGGATLAAALAPLGHDITLLERGTRLPPSPYDRDDKAIFADGVYRPDEQWLDGNDKLFNPGNYYNVGGNSKFFGAVFLRYREMDFSPIVHMGGTSQGWPIPYDALEPYYQQAEALYQVRGTLGEDATEPPHSGQYPYPALADEPSIIDFRERLRKAGLHPSSLPLGVDIDQWFKGGRTGWDAYPNTRGGKMDAETIGLEKALQYPNVRLIEKAKVERIIVDEKNRVRHLECLIDDTPTEIAANTFVIAAGAVQTAALLLASANERYPTGLANRSDQVGRNFMNHNTSAVMALHPLRKNTACYQKTIMANDYYASGGPNGEPLGNIQMLGKITPTILQANTRLPLTMAKWIAERSFDVYAMSEDIPNPESRVSLNNGKIVLDWKKSNWQAHELLVKKLKNHLKKAGYPIVLSRPFDRRTPSHQCGTARMGDDPATSVVSSYGQSHDIDNLFICDASILPTSAAVNPALTIAALALRSAEYIDSAMANRLNEGAA